MEFSIAILPGDGIGPEVTNQARLVLDAIAARFGHSIEFREYSLGGHALDLFGSPLPEETLEGAKSCDAVLLGAVGGPKWDSFPNSMRPEKGLLGLRAGLGVFANLRPASLLPALQDACPLKKSVLEASSHNGKASFDLLIVRELTGGLYFGARGRLEGGRAAFDTETYSWEEIERLLRVAFVAARGRRKRLCVVDKANVLESSRLWREVALALGGEYPDVNLEFMYVDNCAMQLVRAPGYFDVIATSNLFGDILSDEASVLTGSIGMLPSASLGGIEEGSVKTKSIVRGLYEPIHGSAPDIAGKDIANPLGTILSAAMLVRHSFKLELEALAIESAVSAVLDAGFRTQDLACPSTIASMRVGTREMGKKVVERLSYPVGV